jgi:hypothetical protein
MLLQPLNKISKCSVCSLKQSNGMGWKQRIFWICWMGKKMLRGIECEMRNGA